MKPLPSTTCYLVALLILHLIPSDALAQSLPPYQYVMGAPDAETAKIHRWATLPVSEQQEAKRVSSENFQQATAAAMPVLALLMPDEETDAAALERQIAVADSVLASTHSASTRYLTEQIIGQAFLDRYLADGRLYRVALSNLDLADLSNTQQKAVAYGVRRLVEGYNPNADLVAAALGVAGDQLPADEKRVLARQAISHAEAHLARTECETCGSSKQAEHRADAIRSGIEALRAF